MEIALVLLGVLAILVVIAVVGFLIALYNSLVGVRVNVDQAWSNIDVLLKERHDELGKLLDTVQQYMVYERDLLQRLTTQRTQAMQGGQDATRLSAEAGLTAGLGRLFAVAENYPELKSSQNFLQLETRISALEEQIAHRREFYNEAVKINNARRQQFPDMLVAPVAGLQSRPLFQVSEADKADVTVAGRLTIPEKAT